VPLRDRKTIPLNLRNLGLDSAGNFKEVVSVIGPWLGGLATQTAKFNSEVSEFWDRTASELGISTETPLGILSTIDPARSLAVEREVENTALILYSLQS
jgi:hypothetical protein